jgi:hypothetical protein
MERENYFSVAIASFRYNLEQIQNQGRESAPEWHVANGLLRLAQGMLQDARIMEKRLSAIESKLNLPPDTTSALPAPLCEGSGTEGAT